MASALAPIRESPQFSLVAIAVGDGVGAVVAGAVVVALGPADGEGLLDEE
jgi:hypothetical protein